jgi:hypothetical protein
MRLQKYKIHQIKITPNCFVADKGITVDRHNDKMIFSPKTLKILSFRGAGL